MATMLHKLIIQQKFYQPNNLPNLKVWLFSFLSVKRNTKLSPAIMKNGKMTAILQKIIVEKNCHVKNKILGLYFSKYQQKWKICIGHYEKMDKRLPSYKNSSYSKSGILQNEPTSHLWVIFTLSDIYIIFDI